MSEEKMKNVIFLKLMRVDLLFLQTGPPTIMIDFLICLGWALTVLTFGVQILRKILQVLDPDKIKSQFSKILGKLRIDGRLSEFPKFDTLGISQAVREIQELNRRILGILPKGSALLKLIFQFKRKIDHKFQKEFSR